MIFNSKSKGIFGNRAESKFLLAYNAINKEPVYLDSDQLKAHWHILGGTGKGKSKFLEYIVRNLIQARHGLCVIDPHGDLYQSLLKYIVRKRLEHKVILIDPNEDERIFGLNYLERHTYTTIDINEQAAMIMRAFAKVFGGENQDMMPRLQRWGKNTIYALTQSNKTLLEALDFLSLENSQVRRQIVESLDNYYIRSEWHEFEGYPKREKLNILESTLNRLARFLANERIRRIVGQAKSTVDFRQAMDEGKIILVNLAKINIRSESQRMLGIMLVDQLVEAAYSRASIPERKRKPFYLVVDEFGEFVCDDFADALDRLRKFQIWLILAHQRLYQLEKENPNVYDAVMTNTDIKITFGISRENAEIMAKELFTGKIRGNKIKQVIEQTKFWPVESVRRTVGESRASMSSEGTSSGHGTGMVSSEGTTVIPHQGLYFTEMLVGATTSESQSSISTEGNFSGSGTSEATTSMEIPFYEYRPFREVSSRTYYTPEELLEKFIAWIKNQTPQHAQLKTGTKGPIAIVTPWVEEVRVRQIDVERAKEQIYLQYARPVNQIELEIEERRKGLLAAPQQPHIEFKPPKIEKPATKPEPQPSRKDEPDDIITEDDYRE